MADTNLIYPYRFEGGKKAIAAEVNADFEAIKAFANGINATISDIQAAVTELTKKPTREMMDVYFSFSAETPAGAYPLWTGETINNCKSLYPDFWKKLNSLAEKNMIPTVTSDEYAQRLNDYGQCSGFYIDTLNGHVRLPKITRFISSLADLTQLGALENDANKAHTHNLRATPDSGNQRATATTYLGSGTDNSKSDRFWSTSYTLENTATVVSAGEDEAHPKNIRLCLYLQVANNIGEISQLDVNLIIEQMQEALAALEAEYNQYSAQLKALYQQMREDILNASPVIKDDDIEVPQSLFVADLTYDEYPYHADVPVEEALEEHVPTVNFTLSDAISGNYAPIANAGNGYVRIYAKTIPQNLIIASIILQ